MASIAATSAAHIFNEDEDLLDDDDDDSSVRDEDDSASSAAAAGLADRPPPTSSAATQVTIAVPGAPDPHLKQQQPDVIVAKKSAQLDDSRKLFQRLWTDADEIELLQGFLDYITQRGGPLSSFNNHHHDTTAFYDQIKDKFQLDFNKNQLVEKLRRLKKKYRNVVNKFGSGKDYAFKSPHDHATFEISSKIWGNSVLNGSSSAVLAICAAPAPLSMYEDDDDPGFPNFAYCQSPNPNGIDVNSKTPRPRKRNRTGVMKVEDKQQPVFNINTNYDQPSAAATPMATPVAAAGTTQSVSTLIEETVRSCLSPIFKELLGNSMSFNANPNVCLHGFASALSPMPLGFSGAMSGAKMADEKWQKQRILELEVFSKRLELMQDQIKEQLLELRYMGK